MEPKRYQWVGLLAGVPLFSGAWLTAYFNNPWWGVAGLLIACWGLYVANIVERRVSNQGQAVRGLFAGLLAALTARGLGAVATAMAGGSQAVQWNHINDFFRVVLAGNWWATALLVLLLALLGMALSMVEPDAKEPVRVAATKTTVKRKRG